jgi:nucleotide-binding universal stress UspA family protein
VATSVIVRMGYPPDEIAAVAAEQKAGLIIMSLRGRSGLFGEPAGSCTYQVLCHGVAPVLALPDARKGGRG